MKSPVPGKWLLTAALLVSLVIFAGCSVAEVEGWSDIGDQSPREALAMAWSEEGNAAFEPVDLARGTGRVAQYGRRMTIRVEVLDGRDSATASANVTFLYPPLDPQRYGAISCAVNSGQVPEYFFPSLAGMRVGGVRRVVLPRTRVPPDTSTRYFRDAISGAAALELPGDRAVDLRVTLLAVRRPWIRVLTTYSNPAMRNRRIVELWNW
jgi:hypothetical protein